MLDKITMTKITNTILKFFFLLTLFFSFYSNIATASSDKYIEGYIQSLFIHGYGLSKDAVFVEKGVVYINEGKINGHNLEQLLEKTKQATVVLDGVKAIKIKPKDNDSKIINKSASEQDNSKKLTLDGSLPNHTLFEPLIADPKWPRFTLAYHYYIKDKALKHAFSPNFGASFGIYRITDPAGNYEWELGVQAGLFGLMDIGKSPSALINADYFVGIPVSYQIGSWSGLLRLYHISTHLGDEFMLTSEGKKIKRINLSYEGVDLLVSYNFQNTRLYGGGGYIVHKEPSSYKPLKIQTGAEYYSSNTFLNGRLRPVMGIDIKAQEHGKWYPGISCKLGIQLENSSLTSSKVQLMLEFYSGKSMHGQFYKDKIKYIGVGLHAFL